MPQPSDPENIILASGTDEDLMRMSGRSREAFAALVQRHQQPLMNFFRRMGDYSSAEDLTQETFIRLYRYRDRYRPSAKFTTFLYTLARRTWIDHRRGAARRETAHDQFAGEMDVRLDAGTGSEREMHHRVRTALGGLSEEMRTCVVMSVYQGFKYDEIARMMNVPLGTVKTRVFHAMRKLKEALK
jgi:RNA polymerase sigma-70 factor (ECF subfamily)